MSKHEGKLMAALILTITAIVAWSCLLIELSSALSYPAYVQLGGIA
jgi:hypothetical protein